MEPLGIIVSALSLGATVAVADGVKKGLSSASERLISDAYEGLKALIKNRFKEDQSVLSKVEALETSPQNIECRTVLLNDLKRAGKEVDVAILQEAKKIIELIEQHCPEHVRAIGMEIGELRTEILRIGNITTPKHGTAVKIDRASAQEVNFETIGDLHSHDSKKPTSKININNVQTKGISIYHNVIDNIGKERFLAFLVFAILIFSITAILITVIIVFAMQSIQREKIFSGINDIPLSQLISINEPENTQDVKIKNIQDSISSFNQKYENNSDPEDPLDQALIKFFNDDFSGAADIIQGTIKDEPDNSKKIIEKYYQSGVLYYIDCNFNEALRAYRKALSYTNIEIDTEQLAKLQLAIGNTNYKLAHLNEAKSAYNAALEIYTKEEFPEAWALINNNLGVVLQELSNDSKTEAIARLNEAESAYNAALEIYTKEEFPKAWALTQSNLGTVFQELGIRSEVREANNYFGKAMDVLNNALGIYTENQNYKALAIVKNNIGNVLQEQAIRLTGTARDSLLNKAVDAYEEALKYYENKTNNSRLAEVTYNLGETLRKQGEYLREEKKIQLLKKAKSYFYSSLEISKDDKLLVNNLAKNGIANILIELSYYEPQPKVQGLLFEAQEILNKISNNTLFHQINPIALAEMNYNRGNLFIAKARYATNEVRMQLLKKAIKSFNLALVDYKFFPYYRDNINEKIYNTEQAINNSNFK